jgi:hypothetical protein
MNNEQDLPIVELHIKEIKASKENFEVPVYTMEAQTNEDRLAVNWRPISSAPRDGTEILIAIEGDGVHMGWNHGPELLWIYHDIFYPTDSMLCGTTEDKILGWFPIPTPPKEKII